MSLSPAAEAPPDVRRQRRLSIVAKAPAERVRTLVDALVTSHGPLPDHALLRRPEIGLVMVRGRISGTGAPFCAGEMTATRAAIRLDSGEVGIGYVGGRDAGHAELAALLDALGQHPDWRDAIDQSVVAVLEAEATARHRARAAQAAATRVDFFTVAREAGA